MLLSSSCRRCLLKTTTTTTSSLISSSSLSSSLISVSFKSVFLSSLKARCNSSTIVARGGGGGGRGGAVAAVVRGSLSFHTNSLGSQVPSSNRGYFSFAARPAFVHNQNRRGDNSYGIKTIVVGGGEQRFERGNSYRNSRCGGFPLQDSLGSISYFASYSGGGGRRSPFGFGGGGNRMAQGAGLLGAATVLFGKTKYVLAAMKLTKLASLGSMVLTIGTYSMFFGFPYAAGMVGLILVHEAGHALVMINRGVPFSPMIFVPFVGAMITMNRSPRDAWEEALIAMGGPVLGSVGAAVTAVAAHSTDSQLLYALADFGFMINLFNLLPVGSMDGGRVVRAISPYAGLAGLGFGGYLAYTGAVSSPVFYLVLLAGGWETFQRYSNPDVMPPNYYKITPIQRTALTASYFGLIVALAVAMDANERYRKPPEVLMREQQELSFDMR